MLFYVFLGGFRILVSLRWVGRFVWFDFCYFGCLSRFYYLGILIVFVSFLVGFGCFHVVFGYFVRFCGFALCLFVFCGLCCFVVC